MVRGNNSQISISHLNIGSLSKNCQSFVDYLDSITLKFDVILLSELGKSDVSYLSRILTGYDLEFVRSSSSFYSNICDFNKLACGNLIYFTIIVVALKPSLIISLRSTMISLL